MMKPICSLIFSLVLLVFVLPGLDVANQVIGNHGAFWGVNQLDDSIDPDVREPLPN